MSLKKILATSLAIASIGYAGYRYYQSQEVPVAYKKHTKIIRLYEDRIEVYEKTEEKRTMSWEQHERISN